MSFYAKSIVSLIFLAAGIVALLSMLALMGRAEKKMSGTALRGIHRSAGIIFFLLAIVISIVCIKYVAAFGGQLTIRPVFHAVLALALFIVLLLKITIVRFYREFLRIVPTLGMIVFVLAFLVVGTSAGYYFLKAGPARSEGPPVAEEFQEEQAEPLEAPSGSADLGSALFEQNCAFCHYADRTDSKLGPGLLGVMKAEKFPASGRPATAENIAKQLREPVGTMPSFTSLTEKEAAHLIAYLETL
jgi:mono/diheme cytochrome c family protein